jgi:hypothetical protein
VNGDEGEGGEGGDDGVKVKSEEWRVRSEE